jgi:hypothetical protein
LSTAAARELVAPGARRWARGRASAARGGARDLRAASTRRPFRRRVATAGAASARLSDARRGAARGDTRLRGCGRSHHI